MSAQRAILDDAAMRLKGTPGPVLDLGLGAGRTFDHLRTLFPDREVFAFDAFVQAAVGVLPDAHHLVLGEIRETLPAALPRIGARAALVHNDLGSADAVGNAAIAAWLAPAILAVARPDAVVVTSFPLPFQSAVSLPLPSGVRPGRYHMVRLAV
jgi:trans-aconitate methyltransferase